MKDLYKRLGVEPEASEADLRRALPAADPEARADAEFILLHPDRRAVYDRNHRVLCTIGQLRGRLALGLRPFWSHGDHKDFTQLFSRGRTDLGDPPYGPLSPSGYWRRRRSTRWIWWTCGILPGIAAAVWYAQRHGMIHWKMR